MAEQPVSSCELNDRLVMHCYDRSKKIAADRWYVCVVTEIRIPVDQNWFTSLSMDDEQFNRIRAKLGEEVLFSQKKERNFVSEADKQHLVEKICAEAIEVGKAYCSRDAFAARYILKCYGQPQQRG